MFVANNVRSRLREILTDHGSHFYSVRRGESGFNIYSERRGVKHIHGGIGKHTTQRKIERWFRTYDEEHARFPVHRNTSTTTTTNDHTLGVDYSTEQKSTSDSCNMSWDAAWVSFHRKNIKANGVIVVSGSSDVKADSSTMSNDTLKRLVPFFPLLFLVAWMATPIVVNLPWSGLSTLGRIDLQSYLIWIGYGLSLTLATWAIESVLIHRRNLAAIRGWSITASILSTAGGVILLLVTLAFYMDTLVFFQRLPQGCEYCPLILGSEFLTQEIIQPWIYAGILAVVAGAISWWLAISPRLYAMLISIGALSTSFLLFLGTAFTITAWSNLYMQPIYFGWLTGAAVSAILAATLVLPVGIWRAKVR